METKKKFLFFVAAVVAVAGVAGFVIFSNGSGSLFSGSIGGLSNFSRSTPAYEQPTSIAMPSPEETPQPVVMQPDASTEPTDVAQIAAPLPLDNVAYLVPANTDQSTDTIAAPLGYSAYIRPDFSFLQTIKPPPPNTSSPPKIFKIKGKVASINDDWSAQNLDTLTIGNSSIDVQDDVTGIFSYNKETPDFYPDYDALGYYFANDISVTIDDGPQTLKDAKNNRVPWTITSKDNELTYNVIDNNWRQTTAAKPLYDILKITSYDNLPSTDIPGIVQWNIEWTLENYGGTELNDDKLPLTCPQLSAWSQNGGLKITAIGAIGWGTIKIYTIYININSCEAV